MKKAINLRHINVLFKLSLINKLYGSKVKRFWNSKSAETYFQADWFGVYYPSQASVKIIESYRVQAIMM